METKAIKPESYSTLMGGYAVYRSDGNGHGSCFSEEKAIEVAKSVGGWVEDCTVLAKECDWTPYRIAYRSSPNQPHGKVD